jgi:hypothetical protein
MLEYRLWSRLKLIAMCAAPTGLNHSIPLPMAIPWAVESTPLWGSMPNFNTKVSTTIEACRNKDGKTILYKSLKYYKQLIFCQTHIFKISAHRLLDKWIPVNHPLSRHHVG